MPVTCSALGDLHINTKHILAHDQHYYITESLEKLSDGLYTRDGVPNQKNIYGAALALIAIMYGSMQGIIAVASLLATMHNPGNGMDPQ